MGPTDRRLGNEDTEPTLLEREAPNHPFGAVQPCTEKAAQLYEDKNGEVDFDSQALLVCGSAFLFLAARDAPAAAGTTQPANPPGARSQGRSARGSGRTGQKRRRRGRGRG